MWASPGLVVTHVNCNGRAGLAVQEAMRLHKAHVCLLTEAKLPHDCPPPTVAGCTAHLAARPRAEGRGGGALAYAVERLAATIWRSRPADGVLWLRLPGALAGGRTLVLANCYWRPRLRGAEGAEADTAWLERLAADWVAAASIGVPIIMGDLNARTGTAPDWPCDAPCLPRCSIDVSPSPDARGRLLLQFCRDFCARIANGRAAGDQHGAVTSVGTCGIGQSVVDYVIVPAPFLPEVRRLCVTEEGMVADHCCLVVELPAPELARAPPAEDLGTDPRFLRFFCPPDEERLRAAVLALAASHQLPMLTAAAEAATSLADVEAVAEQRCRLVAATCQAAGFRQVGSVHRRSRGPGGRPPLPAEMRGRFMLPKRQAAYRAAVREAPGSVRHATARRQWQRARCAARQAERQRLAEQLERRMLEEHDSHGFHKAYRGPRSALPSFVLQDPDAVFEHFKGLLAPPPSPPTPQQPPPSQALPGAENTGSNQGRREARDGMPEARQPVVVAATDTAARPPAVAPRRPQLGEAAQPARGPAAGLNAAAAPFHPAVAARRPQLGEASQRERGPAAGLTPQQPPSTQRWRQGGRSWGKLHSGKGGQQPA